jgi:hypothetical protein
MITISAPPTPIVPGDTITFHQTHTRHWWEFWKPRSRQELKTLVVTSVSVSSDD